MRVLVIQERGWRNHGAWDLGNRWPLVTYMCVYIYERIYVCVCVIYIGRDGERGSGRERWRETDSNTLRGP